MPQGCLVLSLLKLVTKPSQQGKYNKFIVITPVILALPVGQSLEGTAVHGGVIYNDYGHAES